MVPTAGSGWPVPQSAVHDWVGCSGRKEGEFFLQVSPLVMSVATQRLVESGGVRGEYYAFQGKAAERRPQKVCEHSYHCTQWLTGRASLLLSLYSLVVLYSLVARRLAARPGWSLGAKPARLKLEHFNSIHAWRIPGASVRRGE